ncbi:MAG: hypothetical protein ACJAYJ_002607 [Saprospiraceae bacterium]|jgi:hypothetical protein
MNFLKYLFLLLPCLTSAQAPTQTISGSIFDETNHEPLIGANIIVLDHKPLLGTITDYDGQFIIENVPVGQRTIEISYTGYEIKTINDKLNSARPWTLEINLKPESQTLTAAVVRPDSEPVNELFSVSTRSLSSDEIERFPTGASDPGRVAQSLPGVQPSKDNENDIIIRGNSSVGLLWRLEGVDIPNPNHFARIGSAGGGITIFSTSVIANSDFSTGAFPAGYGNAFAGVFDMNFRNGSKQNREYTIRAGLLGLDFAAEGPLKNQSGSYLFNYRYSTLGILNNLGLYLVGPRVRNTFQDFSFNVRFDGKNPKSIVKIWGIGGLSKEREVTEDVEDWAVIGDSLTTRSGSNIGVVGVTHTQFLESNGYLKNTLAVMSQKVFLKNYLEDKEGEETIINNQGFINGRITWGTALHKNLTKNGFFKAGMQSSLLLYDLNYDSILVTENVKKEFIHEKGSTVLLQPYAQVQLRPNARWTFNLGLHGMYFALNNSASIEPRVSAIYRLNPQQTLTVAYGLHSKTVPIGSYFTEVNGEKVNEDLDLIKANHFILGYDNIFKSGYHLRIEIYYQNLWNVPVGIDNRDTYWSLNDIEFYAAEPLVSEGIGQNYGIDISMEKSFRSSFFFIASTSLFESKFQPLNGETYNTLYNSNFTATLTGGKEWAIKETNFFQIGAKVLYNAGNPSTPLTDNTLLTDLPPEDFSRPYADRAAFYFRTDFRISYRKNNPKNSWWLALDIQNATNRINERAFQWNYNIEDNRWGRRAQSGLIPILSFRMDF